MHTQPSLRAYEQDILVKVRLVGFHTKKMFNMRPDRATQTLSISFVYVPLLWFILFRFFYHIIILSWLLLFSSHHHEKYYGETLMPWQKGVCKWSDNDQTVFPLKFFWTSRNEFHWPHVCLVVFLRETDFFMETIRQNDMQCRHYSSSSPGCSTNCYPTVFLHRMLLRDSH